MVPEAPIPAGYAARVAVRQRSLSSSIARWHGDERPVGSPLTGPDLIALRRTRLFGATGTILMAIGALGAGARPVDPGDPQPVRRALPPAQVARVHVGERGRQRRAMSD